MAVFAVSDIHGQYDLLLRGLYRIRFGEGDSLYVIGDAIDRGADGIRILRYIKEHDNMDLIIGNHEFMMLNSVARDGSDVCNGRDANNWLYANGGDSTFKEYCKLLISERLDLIIWLKSRYVIKAIELGDRRICLTHSYYKVDGENSKYNELSYGDVSNITWSSIWREDFFTHGEDIYPNYDMTFLSGHVPVQRVRRWSERAEEWNVLKSIHHGNLINIDGGCAFGHDNEINNGVIFLRLDDMKEFAVELD